MTNKIELKWYEKKQGIHIKQKISAEQKKQDANEKKQRLLEEKINLEKQKKTNKDKIQKIQKVQNKIFLGEKISSLFDPIKIPEDATNIIEKFDEIVSSTHPLNSKQRALLPNQILSLSHNLTDQRAERRLGYMNETTSLSAYVHYFLWWNLVRLVRLFSNLDNSFFEFNDECTFVDIGSGPLTVPIALLLARPELRNKKINFYCLDISQQSLSFGEDIFLSVAAKLEISSWKIIRIKGTLDSSIKEKADFVTCANMLNELYDDAKLPPDFLAKKYTDRLISFINSNNKKTKILCIEPGDPRSARLISLMRDSFIRKNFIPVAPCCHCETCPMNGKKGLKWCNFSFSTEDSPAQLKQISEKANLAKQKAVLSFIAVQYNETIKEDSSFITLRIASDPIKLPGKRIGYYACSSKGLILAITNQKLFSGEKIKIPLQKKSMPLDTKSGALIINL